MGLILLIYNLSTIENKYFKYAIHIPMILDFHYVRQWMSTTYGYSDTYNEEKMPNEHWAFMIKLSRYVVYLKSEEELTWFKIKHGESL